MSRPAQLRLIARRVGVRRFVVGAALLVAAVLNARFSWAIPLEGDAERAMYDARAILTAPRVDQDRRILMIAFTEATIERTGRRSPLDRALLARALTRIDRLGARSIGIDILIDQPQPEDGLLAAALRHMRTPTYLAFAAYAADPEAIMPWQERFERQFQASLVKGRVGSASAWMLPDEEDGVMRSWRRLPSGLPPRFADRLGSGVTGENHGFSRSIAYRLPRSAERPVFTELPIDLFDSDAGAAMLASQVAGRDLLIGGDISEIDRFATPLTRLTGAMTSGLEIHATMLAQRLDGRFPAVIGPLELWLLALIFAVAGVAAGLVDFGGWRFAALLAASIAIIVFLPLLLQWWGTDTQGLPAFGWVLGWTLSYSAASAVARGLGSEQRRFAQGALGRYLPPDVAAAILRDPDQLSLRGERKTIFALFSDLEGFTKLTHAIEPETLSVLLNHYLDLLSNVVLAHGGTIDKFVGDAVVAFWGAPIARDDDGERALRAMLAMVDAGEEFRRNPPEGVPPIGRTRIGLHRGEAVVGNFGGEGRIQYTALGDAMNVAARLESANKSLHTRALISGDAAAALDGAALRPMGRIAVRGRSTPLAVFEPCVGVSLEDIAELTRLLAMFDVGDTDALAALEGYARLRKDDAALEKLVHRLEQAGPGGYVTLD